MHSLLAYLKNKFFPDPPPRLSSEELQAKFRKRYGLFRALLTANNNALQAMADLEKAYYGKDSYRMAFVRSKIIVILVNVYKMIRNIVAMSGGRYRELENVFEKLSEDINEIIDRRPVVQEGPYVLDLADVSRQHKDAVGEKMASLGEISLLSGLRVPAGFVVTTSATRHFLGTKLLAEINRLLQKRDPDDLDLLFRLCREIEGLILAADLPVDLEELLYQQYDRLEISAGGEGLSLALRSSATAEDSPGLSFAGLYRTILMVDRNTLIKSYKTVVASKYSARAIAYRARRGYRHEDIEMCVGCMVMIEALVSGVTYTRDPGNPGKAVMMINACQGGAKGIVDGTIASELYLVSRKPPHLLVSSSAGSGNSLTAQRLEQLCQAALVLEEYFGQPQDIEWSFDAQNGLHILQSRPLELEKAAEEPEPPKTQQPAETVEPLLRGGVCASAGGACGVVSRISNPEEMHLFPERAVLVLDYPLPEWAPLLDRAAAVIAEHGSEAGHLATVSREYGVPALFGVPGAVAALENGAAVTVNASSLTVYPGLRPDLLKLPEKVKDVMAGSPVQRILTEILQHVTPLNLVDPDSGYFKPSYCETLHDITRFCHEKSIIEMFQSDQHHQIEQSAARRLVGDVPLEWWVIDLADGIRPGAQEEEGPVRVDDIASLPMLAVWRGISAFPWAGPPPVSARGFGSIIFQSAMRPELEPAVASRLSGKNYFLISKNFCNLSARLGYHYALIEAYLSELLTESYVTFRFKGGAADLNRKSIRARLLADILQRYEFRVELRSDALLARVKKKPLAYLESRLQILGYLTLHARQLDMVMSQPHAVERYREQFMSDIEAMLQNKPEEPMRSRQNA